MTVIFKAPAIKKPKYTRAMIKQLHIFDTKTSNPQLQKGYLANALVNPCGLPYIFYKINLLFKHQNGEFKYFWADRGSFLQETDEIFWLHVLLVDAFYKVRLEINKIIVGCDYTGK